MRVELALSNDYSRAGTSSGCAVGKGCKALGGKRVAGTADIIPSFVAAVTVVILMYGVLNSVANITR